MEYPLKKTIITNKILWVIIIIVAIYILETVGYFLVAIFFGNLHGGPNAALNLELPIDTIIPWFTPLFAVYITLPYIWFFWLPLLIWFVCGKGKNGEKAFWQYCSISLLMYVAGIIIYAIMPTVYFSEQFIDGTYSTLPNNAMFHDSIKSLSTNLLNIFGSFPSYHNFWAGILVLFGIIGFKNKHHILGPILIVYGLTISISTLVLHQHALLDLLLTYIMIGIFYFITIKFKIGKL
jgi:hypothetical protein